MKCEFSEQVENFIQNIKKIDPNWKNNTDLETVLRYILTRFNTYECPSPTFITSDFDSWPTIHWKNIKMYFFSDTEIHVVSFKNFQLDKIPCLKFKSNKFPNFQITKRNILYLKEIILTQN